MEERIREKISVLCIHRREFVPISTGPLESLSDGRNQVILNDLRDYRLQLPESA